MILVHKKIKAVMRTADQRENYISQNNAKKEVILVILIYVEV